jgi:hypothetical protein
MSLFKAYKKTPPPRPLETIKEEFLALFDEICSNEDKVTPEELAGLIVIYTEYSVGYLQTVAATFVEPTGSAQTMKFMNSIIAEAVYEIGYHYFDKEKGYSIIDKTVQQALNTKKPITIDNVLNIIEVVELSHVEEEEFDAFDDVVEVAPALLN